MFLLARAVPAAGVALFITFSADHSVRIGWMSLIVFALVTGIVVLAGSRQLGSPARGLLTAQGAVLAAAGIAGLVAIGQGVAALTAVIVGAFVVSGALELAAGLRSRRLTPVARDWTFLGAISVAFGLAVLLIPADLSQAVTVPGKELPNLTASVVLVGSLGAYAAIAAVYLVISGLSLKWARHPEAVVPSEGAS